MRRLNYPLILGTLILIFLLLVSIYPESFSGTDPYGKQRLEFISSESGNKIVTPPIPPGKDYPWGTDNIGRDVRSLLAFGCYTTMTLALSISTGRLLIALPLAIAAAYKIKIAQWIIKQFNILFSAFPLLILTLLLSSIRLFSDLSGSEWGVIAFLLTILGWSKMSYILMQRVKEVLGEDFIEGEVAVGKNRWEIALQNIIPHIIPSIIVQFFLEIAIVLLTLAQLGIFRIVLGGGYFVGLFGDLNVPISFDWPSMLSLANVYMVGGQYWLVLYPTLAFALAIIGFNLFGEGLKIEFNKRTSKVISFIRKMPANLSPLRLLYEIKNFKDYKKPVIRKFVVIAILLVFVLFPRPYNPLRFEADIAVSNVEEISNDKYNGRLSGTDDNKKLAQHIVDVLKEYGIEPYNGSYIHEFNIEQSINYYDAQLIVNSDDKQLELDYRNDFYVTTPWDVDGTFEAEYLPNEEVFKHRDLSTTEKWRSKIAIIDNRGLGETEMISLRNRLSFYFRPAGIIFIEDWLSRNNKFKVTRINRHFDSTFVIIMASDKGSELLGLKNINISFKSDVTLHENVKGTNVIGIIKGSSDSTEEEKIIIGSSLDYLGNDKDTMYSGTTASGGVAMELEVARVLVKSGLKPKRDIIFAFWDGTYNVDRGSKDFIRGMSSPSERYFYLDIRNLIGKDAESILLDTSSVIPKDAEAQASIKALKKSAKQNKIKLQFGRAFSSVRDDFASLNRAAVVIESLEKNSKLMTPFDNYENFDLKRYSQVGQMILDSIMRIAYGGF